MIANTFIKCFTQKKYEKSFFKFDLTVHPKSIVGEVAGKGSNAAWAVKATQKEVIDKLKIPYKNVIVSNFDIDTLQEFAKMS